MATIRLVAKVDFQKELARIRKEVQLQTDLTIRGRANFARDALAATTPKLTGYAASRWQVTMRKDEKGAVYATLDNDADYIQYLNEGHSKQAPAHFIETVLATIGELSTPVIDKID
jgi:HK97 gp10 family phage protein